MHTGNEEDPCSEYYEVGSGGVRRTDAWKEDTNSPVLQGFAAIAHAKILAAGIGKLMEKTQYKPFHKVLVVARTPLLNSTSSS